LQDRVHTTETAIAAKLDQVKLLKDKIAAVRAQEKQQAATLSVAVNEVGSVQGKEEQSRRDVQRQSAAFEHSVSRSELSMSSRSERGASEHSIRVLESSLAAKKAELDRLAQQRKHGVQDVQEKQAALSDAKSQVLKFEAEIDDVQKLIKGLEAQKKQLQLDLQTQAQKVTQLRLALSAAEEQRALKAKELADRNAQLEIKLQSQIHLVKSARRGESSEESSSAATLNSKAKFKSLLSRMTLNP